MEETGEYVRLLSLETESENEEQPHRKKNNDAASEKLNIHSYSKTEPRLQLCRHTGYLVCCTTLLIVALVRGFAYSFGVFLTKIEDEFCSPRNCHQLLGWIESLSIGLNHICGPLSIYILERGGMILTFFLGVGFCVGGLLLTSMTTDVYTMLASYSLLYGIGTSLIYMPPFTILSTEFPHGHPHRVFTTALITCGSPLGILFMNPICARLINAYGWRVTYRIFSLILALVGSTCVLPLILNKKCRGITEKPQTEARNTKRPENEVGKIGIPQIEAPEIGIAKNEKPGNDEGEPKNCRLIIFKKKSVLFWVLAQFSSHLAYYIPHVFMVSFTTQVMNESLVRGSYIMTFMGIAEAISRATSSFVSIFCVGNFSLLQGFCLGLLCIFAGFEVFADKFWHAAAYCIAQGILGGFFKASSYPSLMDFKISDQELKASWSAANIMMGMGMLMGPPLAGALHDACTSYRPVFIFVSLAFLITAVFLWLSYSLRMHEEDTTEKFCLEPTEGREEKEKLMTHQKRIIDVQNLETIRK